MQMLSLYLRNLFFTIIHPGLVAGLIPYWILGRKWSRQFSLPFHLYQYVGILIFSLGLFVLLTCIIRFASSGGGTLSPIDPTKKLVITGLYKYSRNPMYLGVTMILIGEALFFQSYHLGIYLLLIVLVFNLFILAVEEPRLKRDFADEYREYCGKVRRWL
jgi:protein-S-isoprenylcysteine O-methyltransferase Ste14